VVFVVFSGFLFAFVSLGCMSFFCSFLLGLVTGVFSLFGGLVLVVWGGFGVGGFFCFFFRCVVGVFVSLRFTGDVWRWLVWVLSVFCLLDYGFCVVCRLMFVLVVGFFCICLVWVCVLGWFLFCACGFVEGDAYVVGMGGLFFWLCRWCLVFVC